MSTWRALLFCLIGPLGCTSGPVGTAADAGSRPGDHAARDTDGPPEPSDANVGEDVEQPDGATSDGAPLDVPGEGEGEPDIEPPPGPDTVPADFQGVTWLHTDVSGWAQTATLSDVSVDASQICMDFNKADVWPVRTFDGTDLVGNPWIFIHHDGHWWAATWEWLRPGQTCKSRSSVAGDHIKRDPFWDFQPRSGETYGFMVSALARDRNRNVEERSNVVMFTWP